MFWVLLFDLSGHATSAFPQASGAGLAGLLCWRVARSRLIDLFFQDLRVVVGWGFAPAELARWELTLYFCPNRTPDRPTDMSGSPTRHNLETRCRR